MSLFFFFKDPATTDIYPLPLHDALPIPPLAARVAEPPRPPLGSHDLVHRLASRRASPSPRGRRSARTTSFTDSPRGPRRRAPPAPARLPRPRSQTRLASPVPEPPPPALRPHAP